MKIRQLIVLTVLFFGSTGSFAQALSPSDPALFDFWIGRWSLTWKNQNGTEGRGTNLIERVLDGQVIRENFEDVKGFKGMSLSVLNARTKTWRQAWVDNQGGYIDLEVFVEGDKRGFRTQPREVNGQTVVMRMVFYDIQKDRFTWDWEASTDGGKTWTLNWRIHYQRA